MLQVNNIRSRKRSHVVNEVIRPAKCSRVTNALESENDFFPVEKKDSFVFKLTWRKPKRWLALKGFTLRCWPCSAISREKDFCSANFKGEDFCVRERSDCHYHRCWYGKSCAQLDACRFTHFALVRTIQDSHSKSKQTNNNLLSLPAAHSGNSGECVCGDCSGDSKL